MCDHCCIESVKERMLDRRSLLRGAATGLTAATVGGATMAGTLPALAAPVTVTNASPVDLTHTLYPDFPTFFGVPQFKMEQKFSYAKDKFNLFEWTVNEHTGTHVDAPMHFSADGQSVDLIPVERLVVPIIVIDIRAKAAANADAELTPDDLKAWTDKNGPVPQGACVAMLSGWDAHVAGPKFRNVDAGGKMHFPGFHIEATRALIEGNAAVGIAVDTLSLDFGASPDFATHYSWLPSGRWGLECATNLDRLPAKGATLVLGAPKVKGGSGGPCRAIALA